MRRFSSSLYRLLRFARDHRGVRCLIIVLGLLAFLVIGAAGAHDWRAPSTEEPRLPAIELRTGARASERKAPVMKTTMRLAGRRPERRKPRNATASPRRGAVTSAGSGASPSPAPAPVRSFGARAPFESRDDRDDRGAAPVPVPAPAPAGNYDDDDDDAGGGEGGEGHDGDDVSEGGDD